MSLGSSARGCGDSRETGGVYMEVGSEDGGLPIYELIKDPVESIDNFGLLVPIIVRRSSSGEMEIVDGRRRLKAVKKLGITEVPVRIIEEEDLHHPEAVTIQANTARKANPVSEYLAIKALVDRGFEEKEIARKLGVKAAVVTQRLTLANLNEDLFGLMESGHIAVGVGEAAAKLPAALQDQLVQRFQDAGDRLTLKDIQEVRRAQTQTATASLSDSLFGGGDKRREDTRAALSHLEAAEALLKAHGVQVDLTPLRSELAKLAT